MPRVDEEDLNALQRLRSKRAVDEAKGSFLEKLSQAMKSETGANVKRAMDKLELEEKVGLFIYSFD